jgi:hypothetical protein
MRGGPSTFLSLLKLLDLSLGTHSEEPAIPHSRTSQTAQEECQRGGLGNWYRSRAGTQDN